MRAITLISAALLTVTGCSAERVVNTGEWETVTSPTTPAAPPLPPTNPALLANAFDFVAYPDTVTDAAGEEAPPNAIVIEPQGDAHFAAVDAAEFSPPEPANVLPFNRTLVVARFRCNIQEAAGVSCLSEESGAGFTFSADGFVPQYTEVPLDAS